MDDFVCFVKDKNEAAAIYTAISDFLGDKLKLTLNRKSRYYPARLGLDFCGFRLKDGKKLLRLRSKRRGRKIALAFAESGDIEALRRSLAGWMGHAGKGSSLAFRTKIFYEPLNKTGADALFSLLF
jgi:hypothetical protein